jgi:hypothetical protein
MRGALRRLLGALTVAGGCQTASMADLADVPKQFRTDVACMVRALRHEPRITDARAGMSDAILSLGETPASHPFVEYRTIGRDGQSGTIRFLGRLSDGKMYFMTGLNGLFASNEPGPDDWSTSRVEDVWKKRCGIDANAVFN